jgi:hypothetical protein
LLHLGDALIRDAEGIFNSNEVDRHVGCFHQDLFPFWLLVFEFSIQPKRCQFGDDAAQAATPARAKCENSPAREALSKRLRLDA